MYLYKGKIEGISAKSERFVKKFEIEAKNYTDAMEKLSSIAIDSHGVLSEFSVGQKGATVTNREITLIEYLNSCNQCI